MINNHQTTKLPPLSPRTSNKNSLVREEPVLWKAYRRLTEIKTHSNTGNLALKVNPKQQWYRFEGDGLLHLKNLHCKCVEHSIRLSNHSIPDSEKSIPSGSSQAKWVRRACMNYRSNERSQIPFHALNVRWQQKRTMVGYDVNRLREMLSVYGDVLEIRLLSLNNALVIFKDISSACRVMQEPYLGDSKNKLHLVWWHRAMAYKSFTVRKKLISARIDPFLSMLL